MILQGLKINFLGDSITEGHGCSCDAAKFTSLIAAQYGSITRCYGIGGTRLARQSTPSENPRHDLDFPSRVAEMDPDADLIVVFGGTNDFGHGDAPFGFVEDTDERTFCGAFHKLCRKLITRYPKAQLVVMTPLHRCSEDDGPFNEKGVRLVSDLRGYVDTIIEIAGFYAIPVLDLYRVSGIQPRVPELKDLYMPDGLHPSDAGNARIAEKLMGFLKTL